MSAKYALVVDDSATARQVMSKRLREQGMEVDTVESAGEAIDYLSDSSPHVIFMDYEMPGMDGFQALKAIKSNPQTAMIPVLMYTSKEGGLHVGRAQALGAVGVLPKTLEPVGLKKILEDMHLLPDQEPLPRAPIEAEAVTERTSSSQLEMHEAIQDTATELQTAFAKVEESLQASNLTGDEVQQWLRDLGRQIGEELEINRELLLSRMRERREWLWPVVLLSMIMVILLTGMTVVGVQFGDMKQLLAEQSSRQASPVMEQSGADQGANPEPSTASPLTSDALQWVLNQDNHFEFGREPFSDHKIEWLSALLNQLMRMGYQGNVLLRAHQGRFCTQGGDQQPEALPASDALLEACSIPDETESPSVYPSVGFSNLMDTHPAVESGQVTVALENAGFEPLRARYPSPERILRAGAWNQIAAANQFIEVVLDGVFLIP